MGFGVISFIPRAFLNHIKFVTHQLVRCFQTGDPSKSTLKPVVLPEIMEEVKERVVAELKQQSVGPIKIAQAFSKYDFIIDLRADQVRQSESLTSMFLGATKHLYNWLCPLVGLSVG